MPETRTRILNVGELIIEGLNPYEAITLYSLTEASIEGYYFVVTKEGGYWPIMITELFLAFDIYKDDIASAASRMAESIKESPKRPPTAMFVSFPTFYFLVERFVTGLFGSQDYNEKLDRLYPGIGMPPILKFLSMVDLRYNETIQNLIQNGMLVDPYNWRRLVILRESIQGFNSLTDNGERKARLVSDTLLPKELGAKRSNELGANESFNIRLRDLYREFASVLIRVLNPRL